MGTPPGAVAQLGERLGRIEEVEGSIPFRSIHPRSRVTGGRRVAGAGFRVMPATLDPCAHFPHPRNARTRPDRAGRTLHGCPTTPSRCGRPRP